MGMHQIPQEDKELVTDRLAQGQSYSQAMANTAIKSKDTVHRISHDQSNDIERKRLIFLKKIKKNGAGDRQRAKIWAQMIYATKKVGKNAVTAPDWQARAVALKYIDALEDLDKAQKMKVEFTDKTPIEVISKEEQEDFDEKFKKFIDSM